MFQESMISVSTSPTTTSWTTYLGLGIGRPSKIRTTSWTRDLALRRTTQKLRPAEHRARRLLLEQNTLSAALLNRRRSSNLQKLRTEPLFHLHSRNRKYLYSKLTTVVPPEGSQNPLQECNRKSPRKRNSMQGQDARNEATMFRCSKVCLSLGAAPAA